MGPINTLLHGLSGPQRLFLYCLLVAMSSLLLTFWTSDSHVQGLLVGGVIVAVFALAKPIWHPANFGRTRVRLYSLSIISITALPYSIWSELLMRCVRPVLAEHDINLPPSTLPPTVMAFVLFGVLGINYFMRDGSTMREHPQDLAAADSDGLQRLGRVLRIDLQRIDIETSWSSEHFEPLDAEVEVRRRGRFVRRMDSLLQALKKEREASTLLILGDPGSGKSVALRKLASDLVEEIPSTGRIPLYVNLRDWRPRRTWTRDAPPTPHEFEDFLSLYISGRDVFADRFLNEEVEGRRRFSRLLENGRFFLILDSFDEIPQVLDQDEASWLIDELSNVIYSFVAGGYNGRGVLASRYFRRPSLKYRADAVFEIRPFSDEQLARSLNKRCAYSQEQILNIFTERPHLVPALRNPFVAGLVPGFSRINPEELPESELDLFETYLDKHLEEALANLRDLEGFPRASLRDLKATSVDISVTLVSEFGLEARCSELIAATAKQENADTDLITAAVEILRYGRIARVGPGVKASFSFVHRRFAEFFLAKHLQNLEMSQLPIGDIPKDGRWREALVMFAAVAPHRETEDIAAYCMDFAQRIPSVSLHPTSEDFSSGVHALRFLSTSFRARREVMAPYESQLYELIQKALRPGAYTLVAKISSEAIGLLPSSALARLVPKALQLQGDWVGQAAIRSCRHRANLGKDVVDSIFEFVTTLPQGEFNDKYRDLRFSLSLAGGIGPALRALKLRRVDSILVFMSLPLLIMADPVQSFIAMLCAVLVVAVLQAAEWIQNTIEIGAKEKAEGKNVWKMFFSKKRRIWHRRFRHKFKVFPEALLPVRGVRAVLQEKRRMRKKRERFSRNIEWRGTVTFMVFRAALFTSGSLGVAGFSLVDSFSAGFFSKSVVYGFSLAGAFLCVPWFHLWVALRELLGNITGFLRWLVYSAVLVSLSVCANVVLMMAVSSTWGDSLLRNILHYLNLAFGFVAFCFLMLQAYRVMRSALRDSVRLKQIPKDRSWSRIQIAEQLLTLETTAARVNFVAMLDQQRISPHGEWPDRGIPSLGSSKVDTALAQLEERWLGLDG